MKKKPESAPIVNRRARFDYELGETISAGIILSGAEVRGTRMGHVRLTGSYANIKQKLIVANSCNKNRMILSKKIAFNSLFQHGIQFTNIQGNNCR